MATWLRVSTAVDVKVGPFLDSTDGNTQETGLTITQPDIRLAKNGGAFAQKSAAQTLTHEEAGWYEVALSTTDTDTLGILIVAIHESGALPVWREFMVVPALIYDALVSGTGVGVRADVQGWLGTIPATPTVAGVPEMDLTHVAGITTSVSALATGVAAIKAITDALVIASGRVNANIMAINSDTAAATTFDRAVRSIVTGTVGVGSSTTSIVTSALLPASAVTDQFKGRVIVFDRATTTANLRNQASDITANTAGGTLTVTALTTTPVSGDLFIIV